MIDRQFIHLFPSPGLDQVFKKYEKIVEKNTNLPKKCVKGQQKHSLRSDRLKVDMNSYRKVLSENKFKFLVSVENAQKIRSSLSKKKIRQAYSLEKIRKLEKTTQKSFKDLYEKIQLHKSALEETPMIFMKGKIQIMENQNQFAQLQIAKITNYTDFVADYLSCRVITVGQKIEKNQVHLKVDDYEIVMAGLIPPIQPRSFLENIEVNSKWRKPKFYKKLYLLLINQQKNQILYITTCRNLHEISEKAMNYDKVDQIIL